MTNWSPSFPEQRLTMVDCQVRTFDVTDYAVLQAMYDVPREVFVDPSQTAWAYADRSLRSAGGDRLMLPPMVLGRLLQAVQIRKADRALDVAGGSGYTAALLSRLCAQVTTLDSEPGLTEAARMALSAARIEGVACVTGPLDRGHAAGQPYDLIVINGMIEFVPDTLRNQLADRGRLVAIGAAQGAPQAMLYEKNGMELGARPIFSASAPMLNEFRKAPSFVF